MNGFAALRLADVERFTEARREAVRQTVEKRLYGVEFLGDVLQLYLPVFADTLSVMAGGDPLVPDEDYLRLQETQDDDPFGGTDEDFLPPPGPRSRNDIIR